MMKNRCLQHNLQLSLQTINCVNGVGPVANLIKLMIEQIQQMPLILDDLLFVVEDVEAYSLQ